MTYIVTDNCIKCKYMDCVEVCPVDCFHVGPNMLVIDPDECIDCTLCVPECPVEAIFAEDDVPPAQQPFAQPTRPQQMPQPMQSAPLVQSAPAAGSRARTGGVALHLLRDRLQHQRRRLVGPCRERLVELELILPLP